MAIIPAGTYLSSEVFAPDSNGVCSPETLTKVAALAKQLPWPDVPQEVTSFVIDKKRVSCSDYEACAASGACPTIDHWDLCYESAARVTVDQAVAYCRWRGARLPTLLQWQAAVRGPRGKIEAKCDGNVDEEDCTITNEAGVSINVEVGPRPELTSTIGCWHGESGRPGRPCPIDASPRRIQLYMFYPFTPERAGDVHQEWFRCARAIVPVANP